MYAPTYSHPGIFKAIIIAGPAFVFLTVAAILFDQIPDAIGVSADTIYGFLVMIGLSAVFGPVISTLPVLAGAVFLDMLAPQFYIFSQAWVWTTSGLVIGLAFCASTGLMTDGAQFAFGITATSNLCATLCYRRYAPL